MINSATRTGPFNVIPGQSGAFWAKLLNVRDVSTEASVLNYDINFDDEEFWEDCETKHRKLDGEWVMQELLPFTALTSAERPMEPVSPLIDESNPMHSDEQSHDNFTFCYQRQSAREYAVDVDPEGEILHGQNSFN